MVEIVHEVKILASPAQVFTSLMSADRLRAWYTEYVDAPEKPLLELGDVFELHFPGRPSFRWCLEEVSDGQSVVWRCLEGPGTSQGTRASFDISETNDNRCLLKFQHSGWPNREGNYQKCDTYWAALLHRLRLSIEKGTAGPSFW